MARVDDGGARQLAHPGELAAGVVARSALHPLDVARQQLFESKRLTSRAGSAGSVGPLHLLARAGGEHLFHARVDPGVQPLALHHQSDQQRRTAHGSGPELGLRARRLELAGVEQLQRAHHALAITGFDLGRRPRRALRQHGVQRRRPSLLQLGQPTLAHALRRWRTQAQLGQRGPEVETRASDDDRARSGGEQRVDLGVRELGVLAGAEPGVDGQERDQTVLELALARPRSPRL